MASLEQLLAESLPTPPSCIKPGKFEFPSQQYMTLNEVEALLDDTSKARRASVAVNDANHHAVPQLSSDLPPSVDDAVMHVPEMMPSGLPVSARTLSAPSAPARQLRKRRKSQRYNVDESSDDEDEDGAPQSKRFHIRHQHQHQHQQHVSDESDASSYVSSSRPRRAATHKAIPVQPQSTGNFSDDEFAHEHMMSPEEERELRNLLAQRQAELDECTKHMDGMTAAQKKRLRNKHASCVSRLKKKLYICNVLRELEKSREEAAHAKEELARAHKTIQCLQQDSIMRRRAAASEGRAPPTTLPQAAYAQTAGLSNAAAYLLQTAKEQQPSASAPHSPEQAPAGDRSLYCLCRSEASETMIQCDKCTNWFHTECVGLSSEQARTLPRWLCPGCNNSRTTSIN